MHPGTAILSTQTSRNVFPRLLHKQSAARIQRRRIELRPPLLPSLPSKRVVRSQGGAGGGGPKSVVDEAEWARKLDNLKGDSGRQEILIRQNYGKDGAQLLEGLASLAGLHLYEFKSLPGPFSVGILCSPFFECAIFIFCAVMRTEREQGL